MFYQFLITLACIFCSTNVFSQGEMFPSEPSFEPTHSTWWYSHRPTALPTVSLTESFNEGTLPPSMFPTAADQDQASPSPSLSPVVPGNPNESLSMVPSFETVPAPVLEPGQVKSPEPSLEPTQEPTLKPSLEPTFQPSQEPTFEPTFEPSPQPTTHVPTHEPTPSPSLQPSSAAPTSVPSTSSPTANPTFLVVSKGVIQTRNTGLLLRYASF